MRVLVALSGGIDSAVAAALLQQAGHEVIGIHLQFWTEDFRPGNEVKQPENKCCSLDALETARRLCAKLGIPFYVLNFRDLFRAKVVEDFLTGYGAGVTPNPCVVCNREIKFGLLLQKMRELGADKVASGHYAVIKSPKSKVQSPKSKQKIIYELHQGGDPEKDQSYFLHHLDQKKLARIMFPVGKMQKSKVREIAKKLRLPHTSTKKESQGACFFPEDGPSGFLMRHLDAKKLQPGPILTTDGKQVGTHRGLPIYTVGQRRGVDLGGLPVPHYVVGADPRNNTLIVGPDAAVYANQLTATQLTFVAGKPPAAKFRAKVAIRYRMPPVTALIEIKKKIAYVMFPQPVRAVTPGQSIVFYKGKQILGGGVITMKK